MIRLILLAAGLSSRFGENKLLVRVEGTPLYERMLSCAVEFQESCREEVGMVLVTAYDEIERGAVNRGFEIRNAWRELVEKNHAQEAYALKARRLVVRNHRQQDGISHSLNLGIRASQPDKEDILMFSVCDQPYLTSQDLLHFYDGYLESGKGIGCMSFGKRRGNPVLFNARYVGELLALEGDEGGRAVIKNHEDDVYLHSIVSELGLKDIDSKEDLAGLTGKGR